MALDHFELKCLAIELAAVMPPLWDESASIRHAQLPDRSPTRRYYLRRIRWLAESYGLAWMVDQAALGHRLDTLDDDELRLLLADMERGRCCIVAGESLDDAGLVRVFG